MINFVACYLVTRDDFCLRESMQSLWDQGVREFCIVVPDQYWNGTLTDSSDWRKITDIVESFRQAGVRVQMPEVHTRDYRHEAENYAEVESRIRNMMAASYPKRHLLIVDGDEIWRQGAVQALSDLIEANNTFETTIQALCVAGFPGYPVDGPMEGLLVHTYSEGLPFVSGRSTEVPPVALEFPGVIHFTSTRRTKELTISKHRESSHYDNPQYDFEGWIENKLPNLKPGEEDCHMFKPHQIWKSMRHFTKEEWDEIPETLKSYLGEPV